MTDYAANPSRQHFMHIAESDPAILKYLTHPRLVAMAEELVWRYCTLNNTRSPKFAYRLIKSVTGPQQAVSHP